MNFDRDFNLRTNMDSNVKTIRGFKVFNANLVCDRVQYKVGHEYNNSIYPSYKFEFYKDIIFCLFGGSFNINNRVAEIIAYGNITYKRDIYYSNKIKIIRELSWSEVVNLSNTGVDCIGINNTGNNNSGNWNSGGYNIGSNNTGYCNTGNFNTGDYNSGCHNTGDWNTANNSTGAFNTVDQKILMFNKPTNMTLWEWRHTDAYRLLNRISYDIPKRIKPTDIHLNGLNTMSKEEIKNQCEDMFCCYKFWWDTLSDKDKDIIKSMPNFDAEIFEQITKIKVNE